MKTFFLLFATTLSISVFAGGGKSEQTHYLPGAYTIDNAHTRVSFTIPHFVISEVIGRFNEVKGKVQFTDDFNKSSTEVTVPINSIDTGIKQRDEHLRSADFFDAKKYPTMTFKSKAFKGSPSDFTVIGTLTIKDVSKEIQLQGKYLGAVSDPWGNTRSAFKLSGVINRKDFNIKYDEKINIGPAVGNEVTINIVSEAILNKK